MGSKPEPDYINNFCRRLGKQIAEHKARQAALAAAAAAGDLISLSEAALIALPILFEQRFLGIENEYDKMVLEEGQQHPDWKRVYQLRDERDKQASRAIERLRREGLVENDRFVRKSRLDQFLARYETNTSATKVQDAMAIARHLNARQPRATSTDTDGMALRHLPQPDSVPKREPQNSARKRGRRVPLRSSSRLKPFWAQVEPQIIEWLIDNGCPQSGDGEQAKLERFVANLLATHELEASAPTIRRHVRKCIEERQTQLWN